MAIVAPVYVAFELLVSAYLSGPESVPDGTTTKAFKAYGGAASETITTTRSGSSHITFQIGDDKSPLNLSGSWDSALAKYHPEEFDLSGWNKSGKDVFKKLIEARASGVSNATKSESNKEVE